MHVGSQYAIRNKKDAHIKNCKLRSIKVNNEAAIIVGTPQPTHCIQQQLL